MWAGDSGSRSARASDSEVATRRLHSRCLSERWGLGPDAKPLGCPHLRERSPPPFPCGARETAHGAQRPRLALGVPPLPGARAALPHGL